MGSNSRAAEMIKAIVLRTHISHSPNVQVFSDEMCCDEKRQLNLIIHLLMDNRISSNI